MKDDRSTSGQVGAFADELKSALLFLTRLPPSLVGGNAIARPDFTVAARVFPIVGALVGLAGGITMIVAGLIGLPVLIGATLGVATTVILTGALHEDGLADSADSFGGTTREAKLAIMDDSRNGTYGTLALVGSVLLRVAALAAILPRGAILAALALVAGESVSRAALVRMWHDLPAARTTGLSVETGTPDYSATLVALAFAAVIVVVTAFPGLGWRPTALGAVLSVAAAYGAIRLAANTVGGRTGDTLGACQQVSLAAFLVGVAVV
jgi:adenosylcobinamide-GDP ribazoletransferase